MRVRRWGMAVVGAVLALSLVGGPATAGGVPPGYGPHTGHLGLHWILVNEAPETGPELPAVQCVYGDSSLRLKLLRIRQPVLLANRAEGFRSQRVGWQAIVETADDPGGPWSTYAASTWTKTLSLIHI